MLSYLPGFCFLYLSLSSYACYCPTNYCLLPFSPLNCLQSIQVSSLISILSFLLHPPCFLIFQYSLYLSFIPFRFSLVIIICPLLFTSLNSFHTTKSKSLTSLPSSLFSYYAFLSSRLLRLCPLSPFATHPSSSLPVALHSLSHTPLTQPPLTNCLSPSIPLYFRTFFLFCSPPTCDCSARHLRSLPAPPSCITFSMSICLPVCLFTFCVC